MTQEAVKHELLELLQEKAKRQKYNKKSILFPDDGPLGREHYQKHISFLNAGKEFTQRAFIAANRTGKTVTGAYEMACHLTGDYPDWWQGRVFEEPIKAWAASKSNSLTREVLQEELLGSIMEIGTGMIPKDSIIRTTKKPGVADAIEAVYVQHVTGGLSELVFKSYEQGRESFQGTKKQVIWLDEEPSDYGIFSECLTRTSGEEGKAGIIFCTFTPLFGLSDVVMSFLPEGKFPEGGIDPNNPHKYVTQVSWDEVPHMSTKWKEEALKTYSAHEREARSKGIPSLGAGAIYPYLESDVLVDPFEIPIWWPRAFGLDVGWNRTAAIWGALDPESNQIYLYSEHYVGQEVPAVHASAIKSRGDWIWGAIDPRSDSRSQADGTRLVDLYENEGLHLTPADNTVEAGLYRINQLFASGQLKIFSNLSNWLTEYRVYRRDENGKVVKKNDHLMDAMRYLIMSGMEYAEAYPDPDDMMPRSRSAKGRSEVTGY